MKSKSVKTYWVKIYLSGPLPFIEQICRRECHEAGLCVTVEPTRFIYTHGEETGAVIGLINYPRFPATQKSILDRARNLALRLLPETYQSSVLIMSPDKTEWITNSGDE